MSRYFYKAVQEHWQHHGDAYYQEGKNARSWVGEAMGRLERRQARQATAEDPTVPILAEVNRALDVSTSGSRW